MTKNRFWFLTLLLSLAVAADLRGADRIRVGYGSLTVHYAPIWVAGDAQLYRKNGLDAEVLYLESALVRTALIAGDIAMGGMSATDDGGASVARSRRGAHRQFLEYAPISIGRTTGDQSRR